MLRSNFLTNLYQLLAEFVSFYNVLNFYKDIYGGTGMEIQPVCVVMAPSLIQSKEDHNRKQSKQETCSSIIVPPYVDLLEQLITQGYQLCAMRMCWFRRDQAEKAYDLLGDKNNEKKIDVVRNLVQFNTCCDVTS